ncbi:hypothetical protein [uncultured Cyclobacterium sp.]|uniref:2'-5' RNA ligase family protein n=1 Tax=uncultured Cyclobacterium sp. TaxID=453820 RepID=UPI0030EF479B|tara:strand:+ start:45973 stop:46662 length:690 start_codon:yes stop_codon:yes gene_type:complete
MELRNHYAKLHDSALVTINKQGFSKDADLDNPMDLRRGLTLLLRPNRQVKEAFEAFILKAQQVLPEQYFYQATDLHVTVMPIISCYTGFSMEKLDLDNYDSLIQNALEGISKIELNFEGVFASPSCLIIKGYPLNDDLNRFRQNLRNCFASSNVEQSLDKRYKLVTAHSTVVRFRKSVEKADTVLALVEAFSNYKFGRQLFDQVEFVFNDWYQRKSIVKTLNTYTLPFS